MGETTTFRGAIRIVPRIPETLSNRLDNFFDIRHMRRDSNALDQLFPAMDERRAHSLFDDGDFGAEGAFFLPDKTRDIDFKAYEQNPVPEGLRDFMDMNKPPEPLPSLYCDLMLVHDDKANCSYIGWSGAEKAYCIDDWITLLAEQLVARGYHLDGKMFGDREDGMEYYNIIVTDDYVVVNALIPDFTYDQEFSYLST